LKNYDQQNYRKDSSIIKADAKVPENSFNATSFTRNSTNAAGGSFISKIFNKFIKRNIKNEEEEEEEEE